MSNEIKISDHFYLTEFVDPKTYKDLGEYAIHKFDNNLIQIAEFIRNGIGKPVIINNWATGGQYKESGLRQPNTTTGAKRSAHKEGKAIDIKVLGMNSDDVWDWCMDHQKELYALGVREIEDKSFTKGWTHLATRGTWKSIVIIKP